MQEIYIENIGKILKNKKILERELDVKITNKGRDFFINGESEKEFIALKVLEALELGFSINYALKLKNEENLFQTINIKDITKRRDLETIKGRIIGTKGKTLKTLTNLTDCNLCLKDNCLGIIGNYENIQDAIIALESLIHGSKQGNVYSRLEKQKKSKRINKRLNK